MKYMVTFCAFDHTVEGNPFWHGSFFLSKLDEITHLMEVVETWGFYGVTSTGDKNTWLGQLKTKFALDVDFQGNHGMLTHEEVRFMDLGHGLHGYTFEVTVEQFEALQKRCATAFAEQEAAIKEVVGSQNLKVEGRKARIYPEEAFSKQIYEMEQMKAKAEGRSSRLKPFDFQISMRLWGPSLDKSNTCKTRAISLLDGILSEEQLAPFKRTALPRFINGLEPIYLHSTGPLRTHTKASGKEVFYRDGNDEGVKLYWSVPPQRFDALTAHTQNLFTIDEEYRQEVKSLVSKMQRLEWLVRNATLPEKYQNYKDDLIKRIIDCHKAFAIIEPKSAPKTEGWQGFALSIFALPRSKDEEKLQDKINQAKMLLNSLYVAIVDDWRIYDDCPSETLEPGDGEDDEKYYNSLEALVSYLPTEDKKRICQIIGRNYMESEEELESTSVATAQM
jgi:hypothetical protein